MNLTVTPLQLESLKQALMDGGMVWEERIAEAERGERQNLSIEGARMMQDDLRDLLNQIRIHESK